MMINKFPRIIAAFAAISMVFCLAGCSSADEKSPSDDRLTIAVSIVPEATFVRAVAGENVDIVTMVPSGASPETYEPTAKEMSLFEEADIFFSIGVPVEKSSLLPRVSETTKVVLLAEKVSAVYPDLKIGDERDPHIWLSPKRAAVMVSAIADEISAADENNAAIYKANAEEYLEKLSKADATITETLSGITTRKFIAFHPAFGYFADDYNLEMYALEEEGKEATPKHIEEMVDFAKSENIKAVFYQAETDSHQAEAFAESISGKTVMLSPLAADYLSNLKNMAELIKQAGE